MAFELSSALITAPYTVFSPSMEKSETKRYLGSMLVQQAALSLVVSIIMVLAMAMAAPRGAHTWVRVVITTAAVIPFLNLREFVRRVCFAELNVTMALVIDAVTAVAQLGGIYFLALTGRLTAVTTYALLGGVSFAVVVGWLFVRRDQLVFQPEHWMPTLLKNWAFAKWVLASGVLWTMATYVYPWILTAYNGVGATGVWAACSAVVALGNPVFGGLGSYISPKVVHVYAQSGAVAMRRYVYRSSLLLAGLLLPLICVLLAWGDRVISHLYGASYGHNGTVVTLLAFNLLLTAFTYPYSRGLFTLHAARADMFVNMVAIGLLFSVGITAIKLYGLRGAAVALLLSTGVTAAIRMAVFVWVASSGQSVFVACEAETSE
jgi:O-antigen/teichoic acid export membrane protein